jgi:hypothetical protein
MLPRGFRPSPDAPAGPSRLSLTSTYEQGSPGGQLRKPSGRSE